MTEEKLFKAEAKLSDGTWGVLGLYETMQEAQSVVAEWQRQHQPAVPSRSPRASQGVALHRPLQSNTGLAQAIIQTGKDFTVGDLFRPFINRHQPKPSPAPVERLIGPPAPVNASYSAHKRAEVLRRSAEVSY
jgi:hypothetical protein